MQDVLRSSVVCKCLISTRASIDMGFKGFGAHWQLFLKVEFERERINERLKQFRMHLILHVAVLLESSKMDDKYQMLPGVSISLSVLFPDCGKHFKELWCVAGITEKSTAYNECRRQVYYLTGKKGRLTTASQMLNQFLAATGK